MKIFNYLRDVKGELRHVNFPGGRQTMMVTTLVIVLSILTAYFLGGFDYLFTRLLDVLV